MIQIHYSIEHHDGMIKFCELCGLNIIDRVDDGLQQGCWVHIMVSPRLKGNLEKAKTVFIRHNGFLLTLFGVFRHDSHGIAALKVAMNQAKQNEKEHLCLFETIID